MYKSGLIGALCASVFTLAMFGQPAVAQTPDEQTPSDETICEDLIGRTPGLYGLCVAYCTAHDAHLQSPGGDPNSLDIPSRQILANYNKKKTAGDPPMPCVSNPCPCWDADMIALATPPAYPDNNFENACRNQELGNDRTLIENFDGSDYWQLLTHRDGYCQRNDPFNQLSSNGAVTLPLSPDEKAACDAQITAHENANKIHGVVWDCFTQ